MPNERQLFWQNIERIREGLLLSDIEFAQFLGVSHSVFVKCRSNLAFLPLSCVYELAEKLNFHFTDLLKPDFTLLNTWDNQGEAPLPDRYIKAAYSKVAPTKNIVNYLELTRGPRAKTNLIRKFQLSEEFIQNENNNANVLLMSDVTKYLAETYRFTDQEFIAMGQRTPFSIKNQEFIDKLTNQKDVYDLLDIFFDECTHVFDKNCTYRISDIVNDFAIIEVLPHKNVLSELGVNNSQFGNEEVCLTRMGCISSLTYFKYKRFARMEKLTSVYDGAETNKYLFDLAPFKKLSSGLSADVLHFNSIYH
jgi:hypothetical protein